MFALNVIAFIFSFIISENAIIFTSSYLGWTNVFIDTLIVEKCSSSFLFAIFFVELSLIDDLIVGTKLFGIYELFPES